MTDPEKTVFISYRRAVSSFIARAIFLELQMHSYDVFMDVESIDSGRFETIIFNQIAARAHFLIILTPGTTDKFVNPNDIVRREIEFAMDQQRNIVPILTNEFSFEAAKPHLTGKLAELPAYSGLVVPHDYFEAAMERLKSRFLKQPVYGTLQPVSQREQTVVDQKIAVVTAEAPPTGDELLAEQYFNQAYGRDEDDLEGQIADYSEAIRLHPNYVDAYINRGIARRTTGDVEGAIEDSTEAIRIDPTQAIAYRNRAYARDLRGEFQAAIEDYSEAIRLEPDETMPYQNRGADYLELGDLQSAIRDFSEALRLSPDDAENYYNRGEAQFVLGLYDEALKDFERSYTLKPELEYAAAGLAVAHHVVGNVEQAKVYWKALMDLDPEHRDVEYTTRKLNWSRPLAQEAKRLGKIL